LPQISMFMTSIAFLRGRLVFQQRAQQDVRA
jgi:hypothetical protein